MVRDIFFRFVLRYSCICIVVFLMKPKHNNNYLGTTVNMSKNLKKKKVTMNKFILPI